MAELIPADRAEAWSDPAVVIETLLTGIAKAIEAHDFEAAVALIRLLAVRDPHTAELVHESIRAVLESRRRDGGG
jgi:hypothetical protein